MRHILDINDFITYTLIQLNTLGDNPDYEDCSVLGIVQRTEGFRLTVSSFRAAIETVQSTIHFDFKYKMIDVAYSPSMIRIHNRDGNNIERLSTSLSEEQFHDKYHSTAEHFILDYRSIITMKKIQQKFEFMRERL